MSTLASNRLIESAKNGNLDDIRRLVLDGCDVNYRCPTDGTTALYWGSCNGHLSVCDWLIRHGADVNQSVEKSGSIPLHGAADRGHIDCALLLIGKGSNIDSRTRSNGDTPLHLAAYRGHVTICRVLLQNGANADALNAQGCSALDEAQMQNHYDICQLLWKHRRISPCTTRFRKAETCPLLPVESDTAPSTTSLKHKKLVTEMLSSSTNWDYRNGENWFVNTDPNHHSQSDHKFLPEKFSNNELSTNIDMESFKSSLATTDQQIMRAKLNQFDAHTPSSHDTTSCRFCVIKNSKIDDVIQEFMQKLDKLAAYSSTLQLQLTIREDEKDELKKENINLLERLEFYRNIIEGIEESNRARVESERRALVAERKLLLTRQRYEALQMTNQVLETQLRRPRPPTNPTHCFNDPLMSSTYSHDSASGKKIELQPRG